MGNEHLVVQLASERLPLDADTPAIMLTTAVKEMLARKFPDALCYYDQQSLPMVAGHAEMLRWHHDPHEAVRAEGEPLGPYFHELGGVDMLSSAIVGAEVIVLRNAGGKFGPQSWWPGTVVADGNAVLLSDGRLIASDTIAVAVANRESVPTTDFEIAADGTCWIKPKKGPPTRLERFCSRPAPIAQHVLAGARCLMVQTAPSPARRWAFAEVGT